MFSLPFYEAAIFGATGCPATVWSLVSDECVCVRNEWGASPLEDMHVCVSELEMDGTGGIFSVLLSCLQDCERETRQCVFSLSLSLALSTLLACSPEVIQCVYAH